MSLTLAQRARLLPTIGRSLGGAITARATSMSLKEKLRRLEAEPRDRFCGNLSWPISLAESESGGLTASIVEKSWSHLQASLLAKPKPLLQTFMDIDADAAERFDSDEILEDSITRQNSDGIAPRSEKETDLTSMSDGKQDEAWHLLDFRVGTSVNHDAVALSAGADSIFESNPSSVAKGCHDISHNTHCAGLTNQAEPHGGLYIRHSSSKCADRIDSCASATSPTASHNLQNTATPIGARPGRLPAVVDDLLFEG